MATRHLGELLPPGGQVFGDVDAIVTDVSYDSRSVEPGFLFAALRGGDFDGHTFVPEAIARGVSALLVERLSETTVAQVLVPDTRAALSFVAARFFGDPAREVPCLGITGTDGKTTTAFLIDHLLRSAGLRTGMIGTVAVRIGDAVVAHASRQTTPESTEIQRNLRAMVTAGCDWAVLEATSHGLAMHRLDHLPFRIAAVTNVTHEHLDFHGSLAAYRRAKGLLVERVAETGGVVVVNADDAGALSLLEWGKGAEIVRYGWRGEKLDLWAEDLVVSGEGSRFTLARGTGERAAVRLPMLGEFNVANALCAAATALACGLDLAAVSKGLQIAPGVPGRMAVVAAGQPFAVVVDYAHTPEALEKVLRLLRGLHPGGRLAVVFGSAGERDTGKRAVQGAVATRFADFSVLTSEDPRFEDADAIIHEIAVGAKAAGGEEGVTFVREADRATAIRRVLGWARPGDCVLLAGKGHEESMIWGRKKRPWDETAEAWAALAELGFA